MIISNAAIQNRVTVFVLILLIVFAGAVSYVTLPRESAPDVEVPWILVQTSHRGVAPADIENTITKEIEKELAGISGLKEMKSSSAEGMSTISCEFLPNLDIEDALRRVKDKVDIAKAEIPEEADEPVVTEINVAEFPIMMLQIYGPLSPVRLKAIADEMEDAIKAVDGVLDVEVLGALTREIRVEVDPDRVAQYELSLDELLSLVGSENVNISAGGLETSGMQFDVRIAEEFTRPEEIEYLVVSNRGGKMIYLKDIATIRDTFEDPLNYSRMDGDSSITLAVKKRVGANIVYIAEAVKQVIEEARKRVPSGVQFELTMDQSKDIHMMVSDLENNIITALILVVMVLVVFMGLRSSLIVALAIPLSMLMSFAILQVVGYTLNMIVLFSLILALGMLVDNAIVIVENIYRHRELGAGRIEAAMKGTGEVAWPVIASTATTIAAFLPIAFMPGIVGDFMKYLPITVIIVLSSSLFVAMVISPVLASIATGRVPERREKGEGRFMAGYRRLLSAAIRHPYTTLALAMLTLVGVAALYAKRNAGLDFFPAIDPRQAVINIRAPQGTNIHESDRLAAVVESRIEPQRYGPQGQARINHIIANVGSTGGFVLVGRPSGSHVANVSVTFPDFQDREPDHPTSETLHEMRERVTGIAGAEIKVEEEEEGPPTGAPVTVEIIGREFGMLEQLSAQAKALIENVPNLVNLSSDLEAAKPELIFRVSRDRAKRLGVNTARIGLFLKTAVLGTKVGSFRQFNDEYDITIRLPLEQRRRIEDLLRLRIPTVTGRGVPLSSLGYFEYASGYGTIYRINEKRAVTLTADVDGRSGPAVLADVQERLSPEGRARLMESDIEEGNWQRFCSLMADGRGEASSGYASRVLDELGSDAREALGKGAGGDFAKDARKTIIDGLNGALDEPDLYREADFAGVELGEQARQLLEREKEELGESELRRLNRLLLEAAYPTLLAHAQRLDLPPGYQIRYAGEKEHQDEASAFLMKAFLIALLLIVGILVTQFNTLSVPLIIMTTVALSTVGVLVGLLIFNMQFIIIMTGIGAISLAGVVVNNAIVLLDYTRKLQKRGFDVTAAAVRAGQTRLRPVLLTAGTTILGLLPMATGVSFDFKTFEFLTRSESSQWWSPMAIAVICGLAFATILTLVVVPTLYTTLYRLAARLGLGGLHKAGEGEIAHRPEMEDY